MSDFGDGLPLVVGSIRGKRAFKLKKGFLYAPMMDHVRWGDGEQLATCEEFQRGILRFIREDEWFRRWKASLPPEKHLEMCSCGFYAFYEHEDNKYAHFGIEAIMEGYGRTAVGTKGFRSEKARIVAIAPDSGSTVIWNWVFTIYGRYSLKEVQRNYPSVRIFRSAKAMYKEIPVTKIEEVRSLAV